MSVVESWCNVIIRLLLTISLPACLLRIPYSNVLTESLSKDKDKRMWPKVGMLHWCSQVHDC